jgi:hypothetical protein
MLIFEYPGIPDEKHTEECEVSEAGPVEHTRRGIDKTPMSCMNYQRYSITIDASTHCRWTRC